MKKDLARMPTDFGFDKGYWTTVIIKEHIRRETGIKYSPSRICELMKEWGFSIKRPRMKHIKADANEQKAFIEQTFPKKVFETQEIANALGLRLKILFTDEASIRRDGTLHSGYYKKGGVPEIPESNGRFESIKLIGAVDAIDGSFHITQASGRITTSVYADFLINLSKTHKDCFLLIVHDNAPWHGKLKLPALLCQANVKNIAIINLPKYSPEMNPCERFWKWMRESVSHCRYYEDLQELSKSIWRFYRRAYKQKSQAIKRFKTEKDLFEHVKDSGKRKDADGKLLAIA